MCIRDRLKVPEVYFVLNESAPDMETTTVKLLAEGNALKVYQFGEFILYRLEGQYGVVAPLRDYTEKMCIRDSSGITHTAYTISPRITIIC